MHSSSIVHLVLASQPVLSISVAVRWQRPLPTPGPGSGLSLWVLRKVPPAQASTRDCPAPPRCHRRGHGFHIVSPTTCKQDKHCLASSEGLPGVHQEYSGCSLAVGNTSQRICREQSNSYPKHKGDGEEKKPVQTRRGRRSVKRLSRQGGSWART